jgi:hypothetical protein
MKTISALLMTVMLLLGTFGCSSAVPKSSQTPQPTTTGTASQAVLTPQGTQPPVDYLQIGFDLMDSEMLGQLKLGMNESNLIKAMGKPETKSEPEVWGADGMEHTTWTYTSKGLVFELAKEPGSKNESFMFSIMATAPCNLKTLRGIGIGDKKEVVLAAYSSEIDPSFSDEDAIVIGSVFGGILVGLKNGSVQSIFIGASSE